MKLNTLSPAEGSRRNTKRKGRGTATGQGKTAGRGQDGQKLSLIHISEPTRH